MPYEGDDRSRARRGLRLRTLWHRCWGAVVVLLGVALIFYAGFGLTLVPDDMALEYAYRAAHPCGAAVTEDCLRPVQATVRGTEIREQPKNQRYGLRLTGPGSGPREWPWAEPSRCSGTCEPETWSPSPCGGTTRPL
ncbi:hypothetical protein [Streptomyces sp. NPDC001312]|uniref:hypothetical protein n=1 Tax=Streptomyces sp. NPDC001312 TaxID=3364561 RepID=UPI003675F4E7